MRAGGGALTQGVCPALALVCAAAASYAIYSRMACAIRQAHLHLLQQLPSPGSLTSYPFPGPPLPACSCGDCCCYFFLSLFCLECCVAKETRRKIRDMFGLKAEGACGCGDCCTHFCCGRCSLCQETRELNVRRGQEGGRRGAGWEECQRHVLVASREEGPITL